MLHFSHLVLCDLYNLLANLQRVHHQNQVPNFRPQISSIGHERGEPNFTIKRTKANENQPKKK
jgi:hypothetical protein